jgi:hypothetical protein
VRYRTNKGQLGTPAASWCVRTAAGGVPLPRGDTEAESPGRGSVGRTASSTTLPERARESILYALAVRNREVDAGRGSGSPIRSDRHPELSPEPDEGRSEGSAHMDQILRTWESVLKMTEGRRGDQPWLAVRHREVDVGWGGGRSPGSECSLQYTADRLKPSEPPWFSVRHREVDVGWCNPQFTNAIGSSVPIPVARHGPLKSASPPGYLEGVCGCRGIPGIMLQGPAIRPHWKWRKGVLYPFASAGCSSGGPPRTQSEVDVGHWPRGAPKNRKRHPERSPEPGEGRSEGSAVVVQILLTCETVLRMTNSPGNGPPWLAVCHCEVDVGRWPRGAPPQKIRHPERRPELAWGELVEPLEGRSEGSATFDQILRPCEAGLRMIKSLGCTPPIGSNRAREWMVRVRGDCWSNPIRQTRNRSRVRNKASTTRSCTSDAEHEFSRTCSPGRFPMLLLRDTRGSATPSRANVVDRQGSSGSESTI